MQAGDLDKINCRDGFETRLYAGMTSKQNMTEKELFLTALLDCPRHELYLNAPTLTLEQERALAEMLHRRQNGEPVQYIVGFTEFMGLKFFVDQRVLIPRPETEFLVEMVLADIQSRQIDRLKILDLGTGSGCIAVSIAKFIPGSLVTAIDISEDALAVARCNASENGVADRMDFLHADIKKILQETLQPFGFFDMIMANPPYIASGLCASLPEDVRHEPQLALDGGKDGLDFYRAIIDGAERLLKPGGCVYLEIGEDQKEAIQKLVERSGMYRKFEAFKDYAGKDRVVRFTV